MLLGQWELKGCGDDDAESDDKDSCDLAASKSLAYKKPDSHADHQR